MCNRLNIKLFVGVACTILLQGCCSMKGRLNEEVKALMEYRDSLEDDIEGLRVKKNSHWNSGREGLFEFMSVVLTLKKKHYERFHLEKLDFDRPFPYNAAEIARADVAAGNYNFITGGIGGYRNPHLRKRLLEKYNIVIVTGLDCMSGSMAFEFAEKYNDIVKKAVEKKFNRTIDELYFEKK